MGLISVHYHEIALKGQNRARFVRALRDHLRGALAGAGARDVRSFAGRLLVEVDGDPEPALQRIQRVFGVAHAMSVKRLPRDIDAVAAEVLAEVRGRAPATFRVSTRRHDKSFPLNSTDVDRQVGAVVHEATGIPVRLKGAAWEAHLVVLADAILLGTDKRGGPGGLPVGSSGRVGVLLSGGIDSPVAAWRMMKRGCRIELIHFHSHPLVDRTAQEKARDLAEILCRWQLAMRLHLVPLAEIQSQVRLKAPEALRVVLYRRFMVRIAEAIAHRRRLAALVTGESLGQVASQTLPNLRTVEAVAHLPILRPLIGMDKQEIINQAETLGTLSISVRPDQDCCRLFLPAHPATATSVRDAESAEADLDLASLVQEAVARTETADFTYPDA
ncbi:MAG: tRNA uracil 4-sulfurtransferase ThiI [Planctomycetaceae bacterium]